MKIDVAWRLSDGSNGRHSSRLFEAL